MCAYVVWHCDSGFGGYLVWVRRRIVNIFIQAPVFTVLIERSLWIYLHKEQNYDIIILDFFFCSFHPSRKVKRLYRKLGILIESMLHSSFLWAPDIWIPVVHNFPHLNHSQRNFFSKVKNDAWKLSGSHAVWFRIFSNRLLSYLLRTEPRTEGDVLMNELKFDSIQLLNGTDKLFNVSC